MLTLFVIFQASAFDPSSHRKAELRREASPLSADIRTSILETGHDAGSQTPPRYSMFHFDFSYLKDWHAYFCAAMLYLSGLLCSAGGIGGGGIYVTVLMICGNLDVQTAIPLSKSVVFFGAVISMVLNFRKSKAMGLTDGTLIDFNVCRMVVPSALLGTYAGVFLFKVLQPWVILAMLTAILFTMSIGICCQCLRQYYEEQSMSASPVPAEEPPAAEPPAAEPPSIASPTAPVPTGAGGLRTGKAVSSLRNEATIQDIFIGFLLEAIVVISSVFNYQIGECRTAMLSSSSEAPACQLSLMMFLSKDIFQKLLDPSVHHLEAVSFIVPCVACAAAITYYSHMVVQNEDWRFIDAFKYCSMAVTTGCLAGLVGIGGGLIFSPFFLIMGLEPSIAVATSSTCVLFTSSSTTLQYLLTDRIIISLTLLYGTVNLLASYQGTLFVHFLQDRFTARKSFITGIVATGLVISTLLAAAKMVR